MVAPFLLKGEIIMPKIMLNGIEYASGLDQTTYNKIGDDPLTTTAQTLTGATNELNSGLTTLNSKLVQSKTVTLTTNSSGYVEGATNALFGVSNAIILAVYFERGSYDVRRMVDIANYGSAGYNLTFYNDNTRSSKITSASVSVTFYYIV